MAEYGAAPRGIDVKPGEEPTPQQWLDRLNSKFTSVTRQQWCDRRLRPGYTPDGPARFYGGCSRVSTPRNQLLDTLWSYYTGDPPLPQIAEEYQDLFRDVLRKARSNYAPMCVAAMLDRMELQAVSTSDDDDTDGDDVAADIMENSGFAAEFKDLLAYLFALGESYAMVVPGGGEYPSIHAIDPRRCVGVANPLNPVQLAAALVKEYDDITQQHVAYLFLPGVKHEFRQDNGTSRWDIQDSKTEKVNVPKELGGIPIVRLDNWCGLGEYEPHIDLLDRITDITLQRIVGFWYQALRQRAIGIDEDEDDYDEADSLVPEEQPTTKLDWQDVAMKSGPGSMWKFPKDFEMWESEQTDFSPFINGKLADVKEFAAVTSTPLHLITPDAADGSAEGAGLIRESATAKVRDRRARVAPRVKLLWRIMFAMAGEKDRGSKMRLHWGPIEFRTLAEMGSASSQAAGTLSTEDRLERIWQYKPDEIKRNMQRLTAEKLQAQAFAAQAAQQQAENQPGQPGKPDQNPQQQGNQPQKPKPTPPRRQSNPESPAA